MRGAANRAPKMPFALRPPFRPRPDFQIASRKAPLFPVNSRSRVGAGRVMQSFGVPPRAQYRFGRSDVRDVHHDLFRTVHIEYLTTGAFHEAAARLAGTVARRLKPLASIPQRIFSRGPIPVIPPRLAIG